MCFKTFGIFFFFSGFLMLQSCHSERSEMETNESITAIQLDAAQAAILVELPLSCVQKEYPNKLGQVLGSDSDLKSPKTLRPAFYGCFDWHSAVHGHWMLLKLLKEYPDIPQAGRIREILQSHLSAENILIEKAFFEDPNNSTFERTYGWAWLLQLAAELHQWDDPLGKVLYQNLLPLTQLISDKYKSFLPKLLYPIRVGEHSNTAFGLRLALDFAIASGDSSLQKSIEDRSRFFYLNDKGCPLTWEPSGFDFLSPCLEEAALMKKVLSPTEFEKWVKDFLPEMLSSDFQLEPARVSDRKDGKLVHLDGLNFSRAWCLYIIAADHPEWSHLNNIANAHIQFSLPNLLEDSYEGGHWLGSFALYAMMSRE